MKLYIVLLSFYLASTHCPVCQAGCNGVSQVGSQIQNIQFKKSLFSLRLCTFIVHKMTFLGNHFIIGIRNWIGPECITYQILKIQIHGSTEKWFELNCNSIRMAAKSHCNLRRRIKVICLNVKNLISGVWSRIFCF